MLFCLTQLVFCFVSFLHFLQRDDVMEVMERIFVRVFFGNEEATQMLNIYAFNLRNIRQLMTLKNIEIADSLWIHIIMLKTKNLDGQFLECLNKQECLFYYYQSCAVLEFFTFVN